MDENRKQYVDYIKGIGIILVIVGHINFANGVFKNWIYSFHMPLFFFATGLVLKESNVNLKYMSKKIKGLVVPYFIWALIYSGISFFNITRIGYGSYISIDAAGSLSSLWFLPVMFLSVICSQILYQIFYKCKYGQWMLVACGGLCFVFSNFLPCIRSGYPWGVDVALIGISFILFGTVFEKICKAVSLESGGGIVCL